MEDVSEKNKVQPVVGLCIGSATVSMVIKTGDKLQVKSKNHGGKPYDTMKQLLAESGIKQGRVVVTGRNIAKLAVPCVDEAEAVERVLLEYAENNLPDAIISFGGQTTIAYVINKENKQITKTETFNKCGSGTGDFFLQQIKRVGFDSPESAIGAVDQTALDSPYKAAHRCSVFCKSDITHACNEQKATPPQIVAGLCQMIADKSGELLAKTKAKKIWLIGGGSRIKPVSYYLKKKGFAAEIPEEATYFEALGANLLAADKNIDPVSLRDIELTGEKKNSFSTLPPLENFKDFVEFKSAPRSEAEAGDKCLLGIDVGSTTTKFVLVRASDMSILFSYYGETLGKPHIATLEGLKKAKQKINQPLEIIGMAVTGSGRYLDETYLTNFKLKDDSGKTSSQVLVVNEISCHAKAAAAFNSGVKTILEIGGQDAKYTNLHNGVPIDYVMNEACSAGTGSFLAEVVKEIFGIKKPEEIAPIAITGKNPPRFGEQCSAFIEGDIKVALNEGFQTSDILAALCYSICFNYINRVVGNRPIAGPISIQGGTAYNKAFCYAMAGILKLNNLLPEGEKVIVSEDAGLMGAIGAAIALQEKMEQKTFVAVSTTLDNLLAKTFEEGKKFNCHGCDYKCQIQNFIIDGVSVPFGGFCRRWDMQRRGLKAADPNDFDFTIERDRLLHEFSDLQQKEGAKTVGLLGNMFDLSYLPFFTTLLSRLGLNVIMADAVDDEGTKKQGSAFCWPIAKSHGLMENLAQKNPDYIWLPHLKGLEVQGSSREVNECCPFVQGLPFILGASFPKLKKRILSPRLNFSKPQHALPVSLAQLAKQLGVSKKDMEHAFAAAGNAQKKFEKAKADVGAKILEKLKADPKNIAIILVGRPYNAFSSHLSANKGLSRKIASMEVPAIPMDFLPLQKKRDLSWMYWPAGETILKDAEFIKDDPQLFPVFITNFSCGPDSFINFKFREMLGSKPSLTLEFDEHTANAGFDTRIEAFFDIVDGYRKTGLKKDAAPSEFKMADVIQTQGAGVYVDSSGKKFPLADPAVRLIFPDMGRGSEVLAAAATSIGINSLSLPPATEKDMQIGRRYSSCKECLPYNLTLGSLLNYVETRPAGEKTIFFMPKTEGPCRFGMYNEFMKGVVIKLQIKDAAVVSLSSENRYAGFGPKFVERAWIGVVTSDVFEDMAGALRTLAVDKEKGGQLLEQSWKEALSALEKGVYWKNFSKYLALLRAIALKLKSIPLSKPLSAAPKILITGEIYVRRADFTTKEIIAKLVEKGFVVHKSPASEWIKYSGLMMKKNIFREKQNRTTAIVSDFFEKFYEKKIIKSLSLSELIENRVEDMEQVFDAGSAYIDPHLKGEAILTVGTVLHEVCENYAGVVILGPFGCMPTRIASGILAYKMTNSEKAKLAHSSRTKAVLANSSSCPLIFIEVDGGPLPHVTLAQMEAFVLAAKKVGQLIAKN